MESIFILFAYMFGSIPTAYIIAKRFARLNILHVGSGNSGASNLMFQTNFFVGISGGAIDVVIKGFLPILLAKIFFPNQDLVHYIIGIFLLGGHNWSPYIKFRGGRGIAIFMGILLGLGWVELVLFLVFLQGFNCLLSFSISKNLFEPSIWIIIWFIFLFITVALGDYGTYGTLFISISFLLIIIKRLIANFEQLPTDQSYYKVLLFRFFLDRDILKKNLWLDRKNFFNDKEVV